VSVERDERPGPDTVYTLLVVAILGALAGVIVTFSGAVWWGLLMIGLSLFTAVGAGRYYFEVARHLPKNPEDAGARSP
jgi:hypothetical protein